MPQINDFQIKIEMEKYSYQNLQRACRDYPKKFAIEMEDGLQHAGNSFMKRWHKERLMGPFGVNILANPESHFWSRWRKSVYTSDKSGKSLSPIDYYMTIQPNSPGTLRVAQRQEFGGDFPASENSKWILPIYARKNLFDQYHKLKSEWNTKLNSLLLDRRMGLVRIFSKKKRAFYWVYFSRAENDRHILEDENVLFAEKQSIRIPPRLGYYDTFKLHAGRTVQILNSIVTKTLKRAFKNA